MPAPSPVRKNEPTLYMLRTLSNRIVTGRRRAPYSEEPAVARNGTRSIPQWRGSPARFQSSSTRLTTSGDIRITFGQRRVNPSDGHLVVASTPIFDPKFGKRL